MRRRNVASSLNASSATGTIVTAEAPYVGRFAPSPTGPLHFGSLLAAVASYLDARAHQGRWLLRIDNIDPPREEAGADRAIIAALETYGLEWDGPVIYQADSGPEHQAALRTLQEAGNAYACDCSRRTLSAEPRTALGAIYPGTCRNRDVGTDSALRLRTHNQPIVFDDLLQGRQSQRLESESGDFIIRRRDGLVAYHLAVAVDDARQGVTRIVRGIDLMPSTARQIHVQQVLGLPTLEYAHIPVAIGADGQKLSKQFGAAAVPADQPLPVLLAALRCLQMQPPQWLKHATPAEALRWATENWQLSALRGRVEVAAP